MSSILNTANIRLSAKATTKEEAINEAGQVLADQGYIRESYISKMHEREEVSTTYMGNLLAIPHGTEDARDEVQETGLSILITNDVIDWDGQDVRLVIGIAGKGDEHLSILSKIAIACSEEENVEKLLQARTEDEVLDFFSEVNE
ncbi:PTS system mannitol-specific IIA component [Geomicrobium halophilum]|uniref:Mannitol-specific phosphotransferase enzyme IIA component n=1 Tax=Geomicrobium halophilum TaxID=549000 RepID=A0A841PP94_9BACL|nr:PTS sugar transporter subunit IIA [Geomicrobium halophilum]MBB6449624.1 PTS system mannitol-specific IIA component [Geomicrobium halophilum]